MAVAVCRAKDPHSCRVHGNGGEFERLQAVADNAAVSKDVDLYLSTRAQIESLTDDTELTQFIAPDNGNLDLHDWKDRTGDIVPEAPNDMLLNNLHRSSYMYVSEESEIETLLTGRGYDKQDMFLAKHFQFRKDDSSTTRLEIMSNDAFRVCDALQKEEGITLSTENTERIVNQHFDFQKWTGSGESKEQCQEFVKSYRKLLTDKKADEAISYILDKNYNQLDYQAFDDLNEEISRTLKDDSLKATASNGSCSDAAISILEKLEDKSNLNGLPRSANPATNATVELFQKIGRESELGWILDTSRSNKARS